jgi:hypothetical protein
MLLDTTNGRKVATTLRKQRNEQKIRTMLRKTSNKQKAHGSSFNFTRSLDPYRKGKRGKEEANLGRREVLEWTICSMNSTRESCEHCGIERVRCGF